VAVARNRTHGPVPALLVVILDDAATAFELGVYAHQRSSV
jgi:hypothetical protein